MVQQRVTIADFHQITNAQGKLNPQFWLVSLQPARGQAAIDALVQPNLRIDCGEFALEDERVLIWHEFTFG